MLKKGFSLVEMLIYVAILTTIMIFVVGTLFSFTGSYRDLSAMRAADHAGLDAMEKMTRTIRAATDVTTGQSTFGTDPGVLTLVSTNSGVSTTTKFYINNSILEEDLNGSFYGPLTASNAKITSLIFTLLATTTSKAIKIDMTIQGSSGQTITTKNFHSTIVIRNS